MAPWHESISKLGLMNIANDTGYANIKTNIRLVQNDAIQHIPRKDHINLHVPSFFLPGMILLRDVKGRCPERYPFFSF